MSKPKFTLQSAQHRVVRKDIILDVVIDGKLEKDYAVGWADIRGSEDPVYLKQITPLLLDYRDRIDETQEELAKETEDKEKIKELTDRYTVLLSELLNASVVEALSDWDEDFFGVPFSKGAAQEIFSKAENNQIYNQLAEFMKDRERFLPIASV